MSASHTRLCERLLSVFPTLSRMLEFSSTPILLSPFSIKSIIWESSHLGYLNLLLCMVSKPRTISIRGDTLLACYAEFKKAKGRTTNAFCDQLKNSAPKVGAPQPHACYCDYVLICQGLCRCDEVKALEMRRSTH